MVRSVIKRGILVWVIVGVVCFSSIGQAADQGAKVGKAGISNEENVETMKDVIERRDEENKRYREESMINNERMILLLTEIRDLLRQVNQKIDQNAQLLLRPTGN